MTTKHIPQLISLDDCENKLNTGITELKEYGDFKNNYSFCIQNNDTTNECINILGSI